MQPWALVTPASRGIGRELARQLLTTTNVPVVATARGDLDQTREELLSGLSKDVKEDRLHVLKVDVLDESTVEAAAARVADLFPKKSSYLHLGLAIPGILHAEKSPAQIDYDKALLTFRTNTLGPLLLIKHFSPFLPRKATVLAGSEKGDEAAIEGLPSSAVWASMSARVGSITDNQMGGWFSYRASKAGVNQVAKSLDHYLRTSAGEQAISIAMHPGTVKTNLSKDFWDTVKEEKLFTPEFAASKILEMVRSRTVADRGKCWDWKGEEILP